VQSEITGEIQPWQATSTSRYTRAPHSPLHILGAASTTSITSATPNSAQQPSLLSTLAFSMLDYSREEQLEEGKVTATAAGGT